MSTASSLTGEQSRILLLVATRRNAEVTQRLLNDIGLSSTVCRSLEEVITELPRGAAALLATEEALMGDVAQKFRATLQSQDAWSDLPIVVLMRPGAELSPADVVLRQLTNVTLLERPVPIRSLLSAVEAAVRERRRQYQIRDHIQAVRQAEVHAQKLQLQLESALQASNVGTFFVDLPPRAVQCDARSRRHLQLDTTDEVGFAAALAAVHPDDRSAVQQTAAAALVADAAIALEFRVQPAPADPIRWIRVQGRVITTEGAGTLRFVGTTQDITSRRQLEEERLHLLQQEQRARTEAERANRVKDEFLATLSHELRTPLNAIAGWVALLHQAPGDGDLVQESAQAIERSVRMQAELIEDLLDVSRIISGKVRLERRPMALGEVVAAALETVKPMAQAKPLTLQFTPDPALPSLLGDPARLQQVVWNLLSNAVKFTPAGGTVSVTLRPADDHLRLVIADSGEGVSAEFLPHLFERFSQADSSSTRRHGGLGLGLSIVKGLTELHGGRVAVTSAGPGKGTTFTVELPFAPDDAPGADAEPAVRSSALSSPAGSRPLEGLRVLVVDDEPDAREVLRRLLLHEGALPRVAASAEEATELLSREAADVVVSDIGMPGTNGYDFIRSLRERRIAIPAIALTAFARVEDAQRATAAGYQTHLPKPIEPARLLSEVARLGGRS